MILKLGMKHQAIELYKVYINHDPGMTFRGGSRISREGVQIYLGGFAFIL